MLAPQTVVIDFEGFRFFNQPFIVKELSVRGFDYSDTIFLKPPFPIHLISIKAQKSYTWITNKIHGLNWDSGNYEYSFLYCFFLSLKIRFPNIIVYTKGNEKCLFLQNFFTWVIDLDHLNCPKASDFPQNCSSSCLNHSVFFSRDHCSREKSNLFFHWLSHCQQNAYVYSFPNTEKQGQLIPHPVPEFNHISINNQPAQYQERP